MCVHVYCVNRKNVNLVNSYEENATVFVIVNFQFTSMFVEDGKKRNLQRRSLDSLTGTHGFSQLPVFTVTPSKSKSKTIQ